MDAKPFKENPFLASDLEPRGAAPGAVYQADETVIPVRTWARGSPFRSKVPTLSAGERSASKGSVGNKSESSGEYGDLEKYWPGDGEEMPQEEEDAAAAAAADDDDDDEPTAQQPIKFGAHNRDNEIDDDDDEVDDDGGDYGGDSFLEDSGRPELGSVGGAGAQADDPNTSFIEAFNQVYAQYKEESARTGASGNGSSSSSSQNNKGGGPASEGDEDNDVPSYAESQRAYAALTKHLSGASLLPGKSKPQSGDGAGGAEESDIGDLAAYLGLTDTQGENIFFADGADDDDDDDGDGDDNDDNDDDDNNIGGEDDYGDAGFEDPEDDDFAPLKKYSAASKQQQGSGGKGAAGKSKGKGKGNKLSHNEMLAVVSDYQNIVAAMQSPRERDGYDGQLGRAKAGSKGQGKAQGQDKVSKDLQLLKRSKQQQQQQQAKEPLPPNKPSKRKAAASKKGGADLANSDSDEGGDADRAGAAGMAGLDAEQRHRLYLQEVASKRRQEDEMLLRLAIKVRLLACVCERAVPSPPPPPPLFLFSILR